MRNCRSMRITTMIPRTRTTSGHISYAAITKNVISEKNEMEMQNAGTRDEREKKKYVP
jgi:hypothetical protein